MIQKPLDRVEKADIDSLVSNEVREGRTLEYKQAPPTNSDEDKREFLADVSSFANASGGDLLYGVTEKRDADGKTTGIPDAAPGIPVVNIDQEIRRLDSLIRDGIQPRITAVHIHPLDGFPSGPVLLVRIRKSFAAPHMVTFKNLSRFFSRNSGGKYQLDVGEIRSAFALSETLPERIRRFRDERLARIVAGETPATLHDGAKVVLHLLPLSSLSHTNQVDVERVAAVKLPPMYSSGWDWRFNFDGLLTLNTDRESAVCRSYVQFFRSAAIEAVDSRILINDEGGNSSRPRPSSGS